MDAIPAQVPDDVAQVANALGVVVGRIVRRLRQAHASGELTLSALSVLSRLERCGALPAGALADRERISPQSMTAILAVLEDQALVDRVADTRDGRRATISATARGRELLEGRRSRNADRIGAALTEALTPSEVSAVIAVIPLLDRVAEQL